MIIGRTALMPYDAPTLISEARKNVQNAIILLPPPIMEEWRQSYEDRWEVSNFGNVRNKKSGLILRPYWRRYLTVGSLKSRTTVHRLVAFAFLGDPPQGMVDPTIDHIDCNTGNNAASNLQWLSRSDNSRKGNRWWKNHESARERSDLCA